MAKRSFTFQTWTPTAVADTTGFTANGYMALQGGTSTQFINVIEVYMGGQATSSAPNYMSLARDSTVATATMSSTGKDAPLHPSTAALTAAAVPFTTTSGTQPQRSSTLGLLNLSFNAFGGIVRWVAAPGEEIGILGNTASLGEVSLSATSGSGVMGSHIIYEPF